MADPRNEGAGVSRRTVLEAGALLGAAVGLGKLGTALASESEPELNNSSRLNEVISKNDAVRRIRLEKSDVVICFERHEKPFFEDDKGMEVLKVFAPQILLVESASSPETINRLNNKQFLGLPTIDGRRMFPDNVLRELGQRDNSFVLLENVSIPDDLRLNASMAEFGSSVLPVIYGLLAVGRKSIENQAAAGEVGQAAVIAAKTVERIAGLASIWGITNILEFGSSIASKNLPNLSIEEYKALDNITKVMSDLGPANTEVFLRNLLLARKLHFLDQNEEIKNIIDPDNKQEIMKLVANVGRGHVGVEDMLKLSPKTLLWLIGNYPKDLINKVVAHNGGAESISTLRLVNVRKELLEGNGEVWLKDEELMSIIE